VALASASGKCHRSSGYRCLNNGFPKNLGCKYDVILSATQYWELVKSVGNHGSSSVLSMMKGMVWHYVSDAHKVKTALILVRLVFFTGLPLRCSSGLSLQSQRYILMYAGVTLCL
jgi:hypothetical protein